MPERPHIAFPPRVGRNGQFIVNEQDTDDEVASCIAVIVSYPRGARRGKPDFGVPPIDFDRVDLDELRADVAISEPRAMTLDPEVVNTALRGGVEKINFGFDQGSS